MRRIRPSFLSLLMFVVAPVLGVLVHGFTLEQRLGFRTASLLASTDSPQQLLERGIEKFDAQLYREALDLLEGLDASRVDARAWRFYREAAALRLAVMQGEDGSVRRAARGLESLADESMDDWGARAVGELIRAGRYGDADLSRLFELTLQHWEQSPDLDFAIEQYALLLADWLSSAQERGAQPPPALRMWENLVAIGTPRAQLTPIAAHVLAGRVGAQPLPEHRAWQRMIPPVAADADRFVRTVAGNVLEWDAESWLVSAAHWRLGQSDESRGDFRSAVEHYRAAVEASDPSDAWAANEAQRRLESLIAPEISLHASALYRPGSEHLMQLRWRNLASWRVDLRRIDPVEELRLPERRGGFSVLNDFFPPGVGTSVLERSHVDEVEESARASLDRAQQPHQPRGHALWLEALPPGVYAAEVEGRPADSSRGPVRARWVFHVTDLGVLAQRTGGQDPDRDRLEFWLLRMQRGEPLPGVELTLHVGSREAAATRWTSRPLRTDDEGLTSLEASRFGDNYLLAGVVEGRPVFAMGSFWRHANAATAESHRGYLLTDRPLYRPGETVHLQGFVRTIDVRQRKSIVPADTSVEMIITAPDGSVFRRDAFSLDENGSFETDLPLPEAPALGPYHVGVQLSDRQGSIGYTTFQVDEYRLPEFTVSASLDAERRYVLGDTLRVDVMAEYLFGGSVQGQAEVVVTRQPLWVWYRPYDRYAWLGADQKIAPYWFGGGEEVLRIARPLGPGGRLAVEIPTLANLSDPQDYTYTIEARVTDSSRREEHGSVTVKVTRQELYAYLTPARYLLAPSTESRVRLRVQDAMDRPAEVPGHWRVQRTLEDGKFEEILARNTQTAADGEVDLVFTPSSPGHYRIHFSTQDARGNEVEAETIVWCADPRTKSITHGEGGLQLIAERDAFVEDDVARVLVVSDVPGAWVYLSEHFANAVETEVLHLMGTVQLLEIPISRLHRPYFYLQAASAADFLLRQATVQIVAPLAERSLQLEVTFDEEAYAPGERATLRIRARDGHDEPVEGPVTVAVVDEAVLALMPRTTIDPDQVFNRYDTPRPSDIQLSASNFGGYAERDREDDASADEEARNQWRQPAQYARGGRNEEIAMGLASAEMADALPAAKAAMAAPQVPAETPPAAVTVRTDFRTTALWRTAVMTDADGAATVEVPLAESLTRWEALVVGITPDSKAGMAAANTRTRKDVMVRLNHPRVFRERDRFLFAATVHNETDETLVATVSLDAEPLRVSRGEQSVTVPAHGQAQVEWWAEVPAGSASLEFVKDDRTGRVSLLATPLPVRVTARTAVGSDAFVRPVKLLAHGTDLRIVAAAEVAPGEARLEFTLPRDRLTSAETALLTLSPSVLSACIDALPFLADYPYGCTEQTLSRFVPAVAVRSVVEALGVKSRRIDPELDEKIQAGLRRIADFQHGDGGWGWWKEDETRPVMTAYVLVALSQAQESGVRVTRALLSDGRRALRATLSQLERQPDDLAYALYALSCADRVIDAQDEDATVTRYASLLLERRDGLRDYARALLAISLHRADRTDDARLALAHLDNTAERDRKYQTTHWGKTRGYWWRGEGAVETTAFALKAMIEIDPGHRDLKPAARWLVLNREGDRWSSTRASAHAIYSLVDFARGTGELEASYTIVATVAGQEVARFAVEPSTIVDGGGQFVVPAELLADGRNEVRLTLEGRGVCYATLAVETYSQQEDPAPTEHFLGVRREIVRLNPQRTLGGAILQMEEPLEEGDTVNSGDRLRVRLHLTAHNDLEYLAIEDPRPAGAEPAEPSSGWFWSGGVGGRREVRDDRTAFFVGALAQGEHVIEYELRAESPGTYHVMPARAYAMYVPDVNGSSGESRVEFVAAEAAGEEPGR